MTGTDLEAVREARVQAEARQHLEHLKAVADLVRAGLVPPTDLANLPGATLQEYKRLYELADRIRRTAPGQ